MFSSHVLTATDFHYLCIVLNAAGFFIVHTALLAVVVNRYPVMSKESPARCNCGYCGDLTGTLVTSEELYKPGVMVAVVI